MDNCAGISASVGRGCFERQRRSDRTNRLTGYHPYRRCARVPSRRQQRLQSSARSSSAARSNIMSQSAIETLMDRWENDPGFRSELRTDPEAAVRTSGVSLTADEEAAIRGIDWSMSDEQLSARATKFA